jgi:hypothetical protein
MDLGFLYRFAVPLPYHLVVCADYKLARMILIGSKLRKEGQKPANIMKLLNYIHPQAYNQVTAPTESKEREDSRRYLMKAMTQASLLERVPCLLKDLLNLLSILESSLEDDGSYICDAAALLTEFQLIAFTKANFGVDPTATIYKHAEIDGIRYLRAISIANKEAHREMIDPIRRFHFWDRARKESISAKKDLKGGTKFY